MRQRSSGNWELMVETCKDASSKRRCKTETFSGSKRDADRRLRALVAEVEEKLDRKEFAPARRAWLVSEWFDK